MENTMSFLRRSRRGLLRCEDGDSIVEVAVVMPVVCMMVLGFINFSLVLFGMGNANFASRAALRYATLHSNTSYKATTQTDLNNIVSPYIFKFPANSWSVAATYGGGNVVGSTVNVTVSISYSITVYSCTYSGIAYKTTGYGSVQQ